MVNKNMILPSKISKNGIKDSSRPGIIERVFKEAQYYYSATTILEKERQKEELFPPVIMNATFSCELFSKAILYAEKEKEFIKGHKLKALYDDFSEDVKQQVRLAFDNISEERLIKWIDDIDELFEVWRYRYEYRSYSAHYSFVLEYMKVLKKVAYDDVVVKNYLLNVRVYL